MGLPGCNWCGSLPVRPGAYHGRVVSRIRTCAPSEVAELLPGALAGEYVLAPVPDRTAQQALRVDEPLEAADVAVVVTSSGSTGTPKGVLLSANAIGSAAAAFRQRYGSFTWTCVLPTHHVAGLMVLARGLLDRPHGGAGALVAGPDLPDLPPGSGPHAISLVPTQLVRALRSPATAHRLARYDHVLVGGAALDPQTLGRAAEAGVRVHRSYGMSETCGGCVIDGQPLSGVEVDLEPSGRIRIGGPVLFSGYRGDPQATAEALVDGRLVTNDRGEWLRSATGAPRLRVLGRFDDVVISGGVNVDLAQVQREVDALGAAEAGAAEVAVVGVPDPEWGARVALVVAGGGPGLTWWQDRLRPVLGPAALPRQLVRLDALPRTGSGKVDRSALTDWARSGQDRYLAGPTGRVWQDG